MKRPNKPEAYDSLRQRLQPLYNDLENSEDTLLESKFVNFPSFSTLHLPVMIIVISVICSLLNQHHTIVDKINVGKINMLYLEKNRFDRFQSEISQKGDE